MDASALEQITNDALTLNFEMLKQEHPNDLKHRFSMFKYILAVIVDKHAPLKTIKRSNKPSVPWYDGELVWTQKHVNKLYQIFEERNDALSNNTFKSARNEFQALFRRKRTDFYLDKKFWQFYASTVKLKKDPNAMKPIKCINVNGETVSDIQSIADETNKFFTTISPPDNAKPIDICKSFIFNTFKNDPRLTKMNNLHGSFSFQHTTDAIFLKLLEKLDVSTGAGFTNISAKVLKAVAVSISPFLA